MAEMNLHHPVMLQEVMAALNIRAEGVYVDATFGRGGHAAAIMQRLDKGGRLIAIDKDPQAVGVAREWSARDRRLTVYQGSFAMLEYFAEAETVSGKVNGVLFDLGVSSPQLDTAERGFSFLREGPLDMRMDTTQGESAAAWLARATESDIAYVLKTYGEERYAKRIARGIVQARQASAIETTKQLAEIVAAANPAWERDKHPATRAFQAIRIHINRELEELEQGLAQALKILVSGGRLVVISFHSLEDRIVKRFIRDAARGGDIPLGLPVPATAFKPSLRPVSKPVYPGDAEVAANPRARSAVLRVAEKL